MAKPEDEDPFPAVAVEQSENRTRVYDLSSPIPVLRSFKPDRVKLTPDSRWQHGQAVSDYTDAELRTIEAYTRWALRGK
jgi:hypothetical protein